MATVNVDKVSAIAAVIAAIFAGYSGYVAHQTMLTAHQDAVDQARQSQRSYVGIEIGQEVEQDKAAWWTVEFKATGASPALNVSVQMHKVSIDDDADVEPAIQQSAEQLKAHPGIPDIYFIKNALFLPGNSQTVP